MAITHIEESTFQKEVINEKIKPALVDFWAEWCGPCRMLAPILEGIDRKLNEKIKICKLDTDSNPQIAQDYQITGIPCCVLFKEGKEIARFVGFRNQETFESELQQYLV